MSRLTLHHMPMRRFTPPMETHREKNWLNGLPLNKTYLPEACYFSCITEEIRYLGCASDLLHSFCHIQNENMAGFLVMRINCNLYLTINVTFYHYSEYMELDYRKELPTTDHVGLETPCNNAHDPTKLCRKSGKTSYSCTSDKAIRYLSRVMRKPTFC